MTEAGPLRNASRGEKKITMKIPMLTVSRSQYRQSIYIVSNTRARRGACANGIRNTFQQFILFLLIMMGSAIFVSSAIIHIRKRAFEKKLEELAERKRRARPGRVLTFSLSRRRESNVGERIDAVASGAVRGTAIRDVPEGNSTENTDPVDQNADIASGRDLPTIDTALTSTIKKSDSVDSRGQNADQVNGYLNGTSEPAEHIRFDDTEHPNRDQKSPTSPSGVLGDPVRPIKRTHTRLFDGSGVGVRGLDRHPRNARPLQPIFNSSNLNDDSIDTEPGVRRRGQPPTGINKYIKTIDGYIGRNSQFHNLTEKERRKLGGIEYDAICLLSYVVPIYFVFWQLFGALGVGAWFQINAADLPLQNGWIPPPQKADVDR
jgi:hypothetical protein